MHAINMSCKSFSVMEGMPIEGTRRTMHPSSLWPLTTHGLRALGGALVWGVIEFVALARSRRSARRAAST